MNGEAIRMPMAVNRSVTKPSRTHIEECLDLFAFDHIKNSTH
jgi:hypothetical protein